MEAEMKTVKIYIETSFRTPVSKQGKYAAALVFTKAGEDFDRKIYGEEYETTYNRCVLIAMIRAMRRLNQPCHLEIYTRNKYINNMIEQKNPEKWRRSEWKRVAGGAVQNQELWKLFLKEAVKHEIEMRLKGDEYTETLQAVMDREGVEE